MTSRRIIASAVLLTLLPVVHANAAVKKKITPACKLVADPPSDGTGIGTTAAQGPNDPNLDILSADIATNAKKLTGVIRLSSLTATPDTAPTGRAYDIAFKIGTVAKTLHIVIDPSGTTTWAGGDGTGVVDTAAKEIRVTVDLAKIPAPVKAGVTKFSEISATTWRMAANGILTVSKVDGASSPKTYVAAYPSCVVVGR